VSQEFDLGEVEIDFISFVPHREDWRVAVCIMMDINEDRIKGNRYLSLVEVS
jgi:hypothetical protein